MAEYFFAQKPDVSFGLQILQAIIHVFCCSYFSRRSVLYSVFWLLFEKIDGEQANELEYADESQKEEDSDRQPVRNPEREKPKWEDTITNRMMHWSYTAEQKEEVKKALAAGVPKATILTYFYPEVTVEKMSSYWKNQ